MRHVCLSRKKGVSNRFGAFLSPISGSAQSVRIQKFLQACLDRNMRVPS